MKILFVTYSNESTATCRYRAYQPAKAISEAGQSAKVKLIYFLSRRDIDEADVVIFQRIPQALWYLSKLHLPSVLLVGRIKNLFEYSTQRKPTGIDLDDYIFLEGCGIETGVPNEFLPGLLRKCHFVTTATQELANELGTFDKNVTMIPNAIDFDMYESRRTSSCSNRVIRLIQEWKRQGLFVFGWTCGRTHQADTALFKEIVSALDEETKKYVKFLLIGSAGLKLDNVLDLAVSQTKQLHWKELPGVLSNLDGNLVILENNRLNRSKSELKLIEAGYFGVPSICSKVGIFSRIVIDGENGLLASAPQEWAKQIRRLTVQNGLPQSIGRNVKSLVRSNYDLKNRAQTYLDLFKSVQFRIK